MVFFLALFLVISVLVKRLAGKSVSDMTYIVSSGTLNLISINQSKRVEYEKCGVLHICRNNLCMQWLAVSASAELLVR